MKIPTVIAAALAAAAISFAATNPGMAGNLDRSSVPAAKVVTAKAAKVRKAKAEKQPSDCPYLFGCSEKAKPADKAAAKAGKSHKHHATKAVSRRKAKARRKAPGIDKTTTASIAVAAPGGSARYGAIISRYASQYGVSASLARAVVRIESNYRPNMTGSAGEVGLMQIKPATARMLGYTGSVKGLYDPETNIKYGMKYLAMAQDLGGGTTCGTILKYNAGHAARRMNPVSSAYCRKVKVQMASAGDPA
jgi:soluble lytic murein transglycosylase-like protein